MAESARDPFTHDLRCGVDPVYWAETSVGINLDDWQKRVLASTHNWIGLLCARQCGKTTVAALKAGHLALYRPKSRVLIVTPSMKQAVNVFEDVEKALRAADNAGLKREEDNKTSLTLSNESRITCVPASPETIRGFKGINLLIEDEAAFVDDAVHNAVRPMIAASRGTFMMLSTPNGQRGHFFEAYTGSADWDRYKVTASQCPRISSDFLAREKAEKGDWYVRQEYGCEFLSTEDSVFDATQVRDAIRDFPVFEF